MLSNVLKKLDWGLIGLISILGCISLISLYSIDKTFFYRQIIWYLLGMGVIFLGPLINWQWLLAQKWFRQGFYWFSCFLLVVPLVQQSSIRGINSWIVIGGFQFSPAEISKIALIIILAGFFSRRYIAAWRIKNIAISLFYTMIPAGLIAVQPNLGTAAIVFFIWIGFLFISGINKKRLAIGLILLIVLSSLGWFYFLEDYQKSRIKGFLNPAKNPLGVNYNVTQAKIAIGSAGWLGKGFGSGPQTQLGFLPEPHTDFIFASFIEEWGLIGGAVLVLTYLSLIVKISFVSLEVRRNTRKFVGLGIAIVFLVHFLVNIGSNVGILPVIGVSLPFVSYGGSNLLMSSILISIVERIRTSKFQPLK
ncbi:MAG: FtsW/RodA/SpoVE family cell cycle protein [Candidatus Magasanikbacteria bacterium]